MDLSVIQGKTIRLPADFVSGDSRVDPTDPRVEILDPSGSLVVSDAAPHRDGPGQFHYDFDVAQNAPIGVWTARWIAIMEGETLVGEDPFEVHPRRVPKKMDFAPLRGKSSSHRAGHKEVEQPISSEGVDVSGPSPTPADLSAPSQAQVDLSAPGPAPADLSAPSPAPKERDKKSRGFKIVLLLSVVAAAALLAALWRDTRDPQEILQSGVDAHREGKFEEAEQKFREILSIDPNHKLANYNLAVLLQRRGRTREAERYYSRALRADERFVPALFNLATLKSQLGDHQQAVELNRRVLAVQPNMALAHLNLGLALRSLGQREEGDAEVRRALELNPELSSRLGGGRQNQPQSQT